MVTYLRHVLPCTHGNDTIDGGAGEDHVSYYSLGNTGFTGVTLDLAGVHLAPLDSSADGAGRGRDFAAHGDRTLLLELLGDGR